MGYLRKSSAVVSALVLMAAATVSSAATVNFSMSSTVNDGAAGGPPASDFSSSSPKPGIGIDTGVEAIAGGSNATSTLDADFESGTISFGSNVVAGGQSRRPSNGLFFSSNVGTTASWGVRETFAVTGDGTVSFAALLEGMLQRSTLAVQGERNSASNVGLRLSVTSKNRRGGNVGSSVDAFDTALNNETELTFLNINDLLTSQVDVEDRGTVSLLLTGTFGASAFTQTGTAASGAADFFNTATLSFSTSDGVSLAASDPSFL